MDLHLLAQFCWAVGDGGGPLIDRNGKLVGLYMPDTERTFNFLIPTLVTVLRTFYCALLPSPSFLSVTVFGLSTYYPVDVCCGDLVCSPFYTVPSHTDPPSENPQSNAPRTAPRPSPALPVSSSLGSRSTFANTPTLVPTTLFARSLFALPIPFCCRTTIRQPWVERSCLKSMQAN